MASRMCGGRRRGAHGAVCRDVVHLPAHLLQTRDEGVGGDVGPRQEDPVDRVEHLVERRPLLEQPVRRHLTGRHEVGHDAPLAQGRGGDPTDRGDLQAGEGAGVETELLELLPHRLHGVDRGEADPLVAAGDQALDRALHLLGRARRLDRDRRDDLGGRAVRLEPGDRRAGLLLGAGHQDVPAEQRLGLEPGQVLAQGHGRANHGQGRELQGLHDLGDLAQGGDAGGLADGGATLGEGDRALGGAAGGQRACRGPCRGRRAGPGARR